MPPPADPELYWLTRARAFLCRNRPFFPSDVPTRRPIRALAAHEPGCVLRYPRVKASTLESIVGFFDRVYRLYQSESVVLLLWDLEGQRYKLCVPEQEASVWESWGGARSPQDVRYTVPLLAARHLLVGDVHCHGNMAAYASATDRDDERYRDGVHGVVGDIEREPPEFHLELALDGYRFALEREQIFEGYVERHRFVPRQWLEKVHVKVDSYSRWLSTSGRGRKRDWDSWDEVQS